jgi:hypothetical protein
MSNEGMLVLLMLHLLGSSTDTVARARSKGP